MRRGWLSMIGIVLAGEVVAVAVGYALSRATGNASWVTFPALLVPPIAVAIILLSGRTPKK